MLTVLIETTIDIAIEADLFVRFNHSEDGTELGPQRLPVYLSIFAFAQCVHYLYFLHHEDLLFRQRVPAAHGH